jgi:hypothetical protein
VINSGEVAHASLRAGSGGILPPVAAASRMLAEPAARMAALQTTPTFNHAPSVINLLIFV